jgi:2,3-bisphosphoglycerate-dependent phosphoglycerate mutase
MGKNIYIVRHCKAMGQSADAPLTEEGFMQAKALVDFFRERKIERIISSPFLRAVESIDPVAREKQLPVEKDNRLAERVLSSKSFTDWLDKLKATYADLALTYDGGESSRDAMNRIAEVVESAAKSEAENVIIVTHGNIMSLLLKYYDARVGFDEWQALSNPDVFLLQLRDKGYDLKRLWKTKNGER